MCFPPSDLAYLIEHRGKYTLLPPSIWARAFNRVRSPLRIAVEDLRPSDGYLKTTLDAAKDIHFCGKMFDAWKAEFDSVIGSSKAKKQDEREQKLRYHLGRLKEDAWRCSNETNTILIYHAQFASLMAKRIDDAVESQYNLKCDDYSETTNLANNICTSADLLSIHVKTMRDTLKSFVSVLEDIQVTVKQKPSLVKRILGWLKRLFNVITRVLAAVCTVISVILQPANPAAASTLSALGQAATIFLPTIDPGRRKGKESETLDSIIQFFKSIVPREAEVALDKLGRVDEALDIMKLESKMWAGRRVTLVGQNPVAVAKEWRDAANKYRSAVPIGATR